MADPVSTNVAENLENVAAKVETALTGEKTDASKVLFYLSIGVVLVGGYIIYRKAQDAKKQNGADS